MESKTDPKAAQIRAEYDKAEAERIQRANAEAATRRAATEKAERDRMAADAAAQKAEREDAAKAAEHERKGKSEQEEKAERDRLAADRRVKIYKVIAKDPQEPPFHFSTTVHHYIILARSEKEARHIAAGAHVGDMAGAWEDDKLTECCELALDKPGVVARDMGA